MFNNGVQIIFGREHMREDFDILLFKADLFVFNNNKHYDYDIHKSQELFKMFAVIKFVGKQ